MNDETILANRLWNARQLVRTAGGTIAAAGLLGVRPSYVTAICGPKPNRTIGDRMAEKFERCFGVPPGSLDIDPPSEARGEDPFLSEIAATLANAPTEDKEFVLAMSQWITSRSTTRLSSTMRLGKVDLIETASFELPPKRIASAPQRKITKELVHASHQTKKR